MDTFALLKVLFSVLTGFLFGLVISWTMANLDVSCTGGHTTIIPQKRRSLRFREEMTVREPLYVAVITTEHFLNSRAKTINNTWAQMAPVVEYYTGQGQWPLLKLPVVSLRGTDDSYPPWKKVYYMYQYLYDNYIDQYHWFMRADDDVYVRVPELLNFLSKLDPTQPLYIGSPGSGKKDDLKQLNLQASETYCMGGTGVILSHALLRKLGPHLKECLKNVVASYIEDAEVGRCISRRLGIQCTKSYEMTKLFFQDYSYGNAMFASNGSLKNNLDKKTRVQLSKVLTFHPLKSKEKMTSIHKYFVDLQIKKLKTKIIKLQNIDFYRPMDGAPQTVL